LKITFLNSLHPANDKRLFYKEAISIVNHRHNVTFLGPYCKRFEERDGVIIKGLGEIRFFNRFWIIIKLFVSALSEKTDIYQCNEINSWFVGIIVGKIKRVPVIFDAHEYYPSRLENKIKPFFERHLSLLIKVIMQMLSLYTDMVITVSEQLMNKYKFLKCPVDVIHNYSNIQKSGAIQLNLNEIRKSFPILISIGLISIDRGIEIILGGLAILKKKFPDILYLIIGKNTVNLSQQNRVLSLIKELQIQDNIKFIDWIDFNMVNSYLTISTIGLILFQISLYNNKIGQPHKFFDYLNSGLPVIVPKDTTLEKIVYEYRAGVAVDSSNYKSFANGVEQLLVMVNNNIINRKNIKNIANEKFSWKNEEEKYIALLESVI